MVDARHICWGCRAPSVGVAGHIFNCASSDSSAGQMSRLIFVVLTPRLKHSGVLPIHIPRCCPMRVLPGDAMIVARSDLEILFRHEVGQEG